MSVWKGWVMKQEICKFCSIPSDPAEQYRVIFRDEHFYVLLDLFPQTEGHTLVVFNSHFDSLSEIPEVLQKDVFLATTKLAEAIKTILGAKAYVIKVNNELYKLESSDELHVGHTHFHVIPRYSEKDSLLGKPNEATESQLIKLNQKLSKAEATDIAKVRVKT